jgi:murein L,D-transpeptidase YcbB/YkuD
MLHACTGSSDGRRGRRPRRAAGHAGAGARHAPRPVARETARRAGARRPSFKAAGVAIAIALLCAPAAAEPTDGSATPRNIRQLVERPSGLRIADRPLDRRALARVYRARHFAPAWDAADGGSERASLLLQRLANADAHGLEPERYHVDAIRARQARPDTGRPVELELLLSDAFLRYANDVRAGRRPGGHADPDWGIPAPPFDPVAALTGALDRPATFAATLASLPPAMEGYRHLVEGLRRYRDIAARIGWPPVAPGPPLRPGSDDTRLAALAARLAAEDERVSWTAGSRYDGPLEEAVRRFQARHGLAVDGIVGPATLGALNVPVAERIRQIVLNLERWRWLPRDLGRHYIAVNAAAAMLQVVDEGRAVLTSRVVVGDVRHPTPVVQAWLDAVVLNPPWNVPASIAVAEILPKLRKQPRYLADNDIVILERRRRDPFGLRVDWSAIRAESFPFRLQQQPGPANPLGRIKFDAPNRFDVYLHDTPARSLFARPVRTASHGCIRLERADDLAAHVLGGSLGWTRETLEAAIATGQSQRISVARPLPVYVLYWTAFADPDGRVHFRDDVYGRDRRLAAVLAMEPVAVPHLARGVGGCQPAREEASP